MRIRRRAVGPPSAVPDPLQRLRSGFGAFRESQFDSGALGYRLLAVEGQRPEILLIGCSDSRVDPAVLTGSGAGDLFVVRNIAALVPPYGNEARLKGTSSAVEFAVRALEVRHVVVLGHALCGGVRALAAGREETDGRFEFIADWMEIAGDARRAVAAALADKPEPERLRALEQATTLASLRNLLGFPWIAERVAAGALALHAWYFDLIDGNLWAYDPRERGFRLADDRPSGIDGPCPPVDIDDFARRAGAYRCRKTGGPYACRCDAEADLERVTPAGALPF